MPRLYIEICVAGETLQLRSGQAPRYQACDANASPAGRGRPALQRNTRARAPALDWAGLTRRGGYDADGRLRATSAGPTR